MDKTYAEDNKTQTPINSKVSGHSEFTGSSAPTSGTNADSMTNAQGEFAPSRPKSPPIATSGHQPGRLVGNDAAPEFHAKILPAGSAPKKDTYQPNPVEETPSQANNPDASRSHGKESTETSASDTLGGATSADVHKGIGVPISGQSANDTKGHKDPGPKIGEGEGGSGLTGDADAKAQKLMSDTEPGPKSAREHNVSLDGAESKEPVHAEQVQSMGQGSRKEAYDKSSYSGKGGPNS